MAAKPKDLTERLTITVPKSVRAALKSHLESSGDSESGFVSELLRRVLNVGEKGLSADEATSLHDLQEKLRLFVQDDRTGTANLDANSPCARVMAELSKGHFDGPGIRPAVPWFLLAMLTNPGRLANALESQDVYVPRVDYSCPDVRAALIALTFQWNNARLIGLDFKVLTPKPGAFDAIINLEFALSSKTIFPFPCFQTEFRRPLFGLVPYGKHVAIGWLVHEENPLVEMFGLKGDFKNHALLMSSQAAARRLQFLSELFGRVSHGEITLFTKDNYLNREILPLMKANAQRGLLVSTFSERRFATTIADDSGWTTAMSNTAAKNSVLLYDLFADREIVGKSSNFLQLPFLHDQDIPVGIGFSLPALPLMARQVSQSKKSIAVTLREEVQRTVKANPQKIEKEFWSDGMLLDPDLRSNSGESEEQFSKKMCDGSNQSK